MQINKQTEEPVDLLMHSGCSALLEEKCIYSKTRAKIEIEIAIKVKIQPI